MEASISNAISTGGYFVLGTFFFAAMGMILYKVARKA